MELILPPLVRAIVTLITQWARPQLVLGLDQGEIVGILVWLERKKASLRSIITKHLLSQGKTVMMDSRFTLLSFKLKITWNMEAFQFKKEQWWILKKHLKASYLLSNRKSYKERKKKNLFWKDRTTLELLTTLIWECRMNNSLLVLLQPSKLATPTIQSHNHLP